MYSHMTFRYMYDFRPTFVYPVHEGGYEGGYGGWDEGRGMRGYSGGSSSSWTILVVITVDVVIVITLSVHWNILSVLFVGIQLRVLF